MLNKHNNHLNIIYYKDNYIELQEFFDQDTSITSTSNNELTSTTSILNNELTSNIINNAAISKIKLIKALLIIFDESDCIFNLGLCIPFSTIDKENEIKLNAETFNVQDKAKQTKPIVAERIQPSRKAKK